MKLSKQWAEVTKALSTNTMADTPKFVGVIADGNGRKIASLIADTKEDCERKTLEVFQEYQTDWNKTPADERETDPPMWDIYERIRSEATVVHPPNQSQ